VFDVGGGAARSDLLILSARGDEDGARAGVGEEGNDLVGEQVGIDGDVGGADGEAGEVGEGPLPAIFGEDGDAIAFADAPGAERSGDGTNALIDLRGGDGLPAGRVVLEQHGAVAAAVRDDEENVVERL